MSNILILEDNPERVEVFRAALAPLGAVVNVTRDPRIANRWLEQREYAGIFLDCDLEPHHYTLGSLNTTFDHERGIAVAHHLANHPELSRNAMIIIHSLSDDAPRMEEILRAGGRTKIGRVPFHYLDFGSLSDLR